MVIKVSVPTLFHSLLLENAEKENGPVANSATPPNDKKGILFLSTMKFTEHSEVY